MLSQKSNISSLARSILACKEDAKNQDNAFIREVYSAPEPIVVLAANEQVKNVTMFCTKEARFSVFEVDPTFDIGQFSVTATQYQYLLLLHRRSSKHPAMVGPMLIHQKR